MSSGWGCDWVSRFKLSLSACICFFPVYGSFEDITPMAFYNTQVRWRKLFDLLTGTFSFLSDFDRMLNYSVLLPWWSIIHTHYIIIMWLHLCQLWVIELNPYLTRSTCEKATLYANGLRRESTVRTGPILGCSYFLVACVQQPIISSDRVNSISCCSYQCVQKLISYLICL